MEGSRRRRQVARDARARYLSATGPRLQKDFSATKITEPGCYRGVEDERYEDCEDGSSAIVHLIKRRWEWFLSWPILQKVIRNGGAKLVHVAYVDRKAYVTYIEACKVFIAHEAHY